MATADGTATLHFDHAHGALGARPYRRSAPPLARFIPYHTYTLGTSVSEAAARPNRRRTACCQTAAAAPRCTRAAAGRRTPPGSPCGRASRSTTSLGSTARRGCWVRGTFLRAKTACLLIFCSAGTGAVQTPAGAVRLRYLPPCQGTSRSRSTRTAATTSGRRRTSHRRSCARSRRTSLRRR